MAFRYSDVPRMRLVLGFAAFSASAAAFRMISSPIGLPDRISSANLQRSGVVATGPTAIRTLVKFFLPGSVPTTTATVRIGRTRVFLLASRIAALASPFPRAGKEIPVTISFVLSILVLPMPVKSPASGIVRSPCRLRIVTDPSSARSGITVSAPGSSQTASSVCGVSLASNIFLTVIRSTCSLSSRRCSISRKMRG